MYKKDYKLIAETINAIVVNLKTTLAYQHPGELDAAYTNSELEGIGRVVKDLAIEFSDEDNWFDSDKFTKACGF